MIERAVVIVVALSTCVLSLPVTSGELENEDVKVMKCIVEALADVLSKPHPLPVSQECLDTLRTDDRLFSILRHHNFLKEMQDIAVSGANKRAQLQGHDIMVADQVTQIPRRTEDAADQSMLEALGGPGEQSILAQKRRRSGEGDHKEEEEEKRAQESQESQEHNETAGKEEEKEEGERKSGGEKDVSDERIADWMADRPEKRKQDEVGGGAGGEGGEEDEEREEKRSHTEDQSQEGLGVRHVTKEKKDDDSNLTRNSHNAKSGEEEEAEEEEGEALNRKRSTLPPHGATATEEEEDEEEEEVKRGNDFARWSRQTKRLPMRKKNVSEKEEREETSSSSQQEVAHHSKEAALGGEEEEPEEEEEEEKAKRAELQKSREEKELRTIALRRAPEEKRGLEEEGSAIRKSEEPEIASLAAIESELENVAQKLHQLRRG